jgi:hypothetical protein
VRILKLAMLVYSLLTLATAGYLCLCYVALEDPDITESWVFMLGLPSSLGFVAAVPDDETRWFALAAAVTFQGVMIWAIVPAWVERRQGRTRRR